MTKRTKRNPTRKEVGSGLVGAGLALLGLTALCRWAKSPKRTYRNVESPFGEVKQRQGGRELGGHGY